MIGRSSAVYAGALVYAIAFHFAYVSYINPQFEYANYLYFRPQAWQVAATYLLALFPLVLYRASAAPAAFGASLVFVLSYVPGIMVLMLAWQRSQSELLAVQSCLSVSMSALFVASRSGSGSWRHEDVPTYSGNRLAAIVQAITLVCVTMLVVFYRDTMQIVSFEDVYDLRSEAAEIAVPAFAAYLLSWLSYCFLPFLVAWAIVRKSIPSLIWVLLGSALIYAATGAKSSVLLPFIVIGINFLLNRSGGATFLIRVMWSLTGVIAVVVFLLPDEGLWIWAKSLLLLRTLGTGGWVLLTYYEYFAENGHTFYTHIGPVAAITDAYPYGELSLGQLIGLEHSGSTEANFNANFWASDGFAALGLAGVPIVTVVICGLFYLINRVSAGYSPRFVSLWLTGFWFAMLNLPLTTALLSGGGLVSIVLLWSARLRWHADTAGLKASGGDMATGPMLRSNPYLG